MSPGKLPAEQRHRTKRVSEVEQMKAASCPWRDWPVISSAQHTIIFHRNLHNPKLKNHFQDYHVRKNLRQETALLLNYISQLRAFSEVLAIYCSHAVRKGRKKNRQWKWEGDGWMPTPTPKDTIKTLRTNSLKALRVLTTIQNANHT